MAAILLLLAAALFPAALALLLCRKLHIAHLLEWLFAALTLGLLAAGWIALVLAELGLFSLAALGAIWAAVTALLAWSLARRPGLLRRSDQPALHGQTSAGPRIAVRQPIPKWELAALALWAVAAAFLFFRPHEFILGGADAGVYINLGASIARSGGIILDDPFVASFGEALAPALLRQLPASEHAPYYLLPGFYVPDALSGQVIPQFYALHPVWLAVSYTLGRVPAELLLTGLWAFLASFAAYLWVRRLWGAPAALLALASLTITGLQVWFARYPTAEMLTQYLFLTGAWAFTVWVTEDEPHPVWPILAGAALGQLFLTRIDVLPLLAILPLVYIWRRWRGSSRRQDIWFYALFGLFVAHSLLHGVWQSAPYFFNQLGFQVRLLRLLQRHSILVGAVSGAGLALLLYLDRHRPARQRLAAGLARYRLAWAAPLALSVIGLALYAYFVRPRIGQAVFYEYWYAGGSIPNLDHENLLRLGWYLTPFGVMLATLSVALMIVQEDFRRVAFLLGTGLFFALFYLLWMQNNPHQVYAMRRYVPVVIPFLVISVAYAINWVSARPERLTVTAARTRTGGFSRSPAPSRRAWLWRAAAGSLAAAWLIALALSARGLVTQRDFQGLTVQVEQLNAVFQPRSVIIYYDPTPVGLGDLFGTPLRFLYGHDVVVIRDLEKLDRAAFQRLINQWRQQGRPRYWVTPDGDYPWPLPGEQAQELLRWPVRAKMLEATYEHRPQQIIDLEWWQKISTIP